VPLKGVQPGIAASPPFTAEIVRMDREVVKPIED